MEARWNLAVLKNQHRFEKPRDARCGLQMAKVGFYGADRQRRVGGSIAAESFRESMRFDRIANRCPSAVGFDESDLLGRDPGIPAGILHQSCLRLRAGQRDAVGVSILIDRRPQNYALNRIAIRDRPRKPLEQDHAGALATHKSARGCVERRAPALGREHRSLRKPDKPAGRNHHGDAARQGGVSAPGPDVFARRVNSGERRRARRVHRDTGAAQIQAIRNSICGNAMRAPRRRMRADAEMIETRALNSLVIVMRYADENSEIGSAFEIEDESGIFDRFPRGLEEEAMLRIHVRSFPRRDTKELRIKLIDGVNKPAALGDGFAGHTRLGIVISLHVPAIRRHFNDAFTAFDEKLPKGILGAHAAGKTAADSNNGNTFFLHGRELPRRGGLISAAYEQVKSATRPGAEL